MPAMSSEALAHLLEIQEAAALVRGVLDDLDENDGLSAMLTDAANALANAVTIAKDRR